MLILWKGKYSHFYFARCCFLTFLNSCFSCMGPEEQKLRWGAVHLLHLLPSPPGLVPEHHWQSLRAAQPSHPTVPVSVEAAVVGPGQPQPLQLWNLHQPQSSAREILFSSEPCQPCISDCLYRCKSLPTSSVNEQFGEGKTENTAVLFVCWPTKSLFC